MFRMMVMVFSFVHAAIGNLSIVDGQSSIE